MSNNPAERWGLPADFAPARFPIGDEEKELIREMLGADEPVLVTLVNENNTTTIVATTQRLFTIRSGQGAGVTGFTVREFPWSGIHDMRLTQMGTNVKIQVGFKSRDNGRTAEIGPKAAFAKDAIDDLKPFETNAGTQCFEAMHTLWHTLRAAAD